ncbi:MAG: PrgI family protein [Candidatus Moranbacteria bacterium]|nr:PrgI family protein [Candidatus Moranbacteria bacterium]
MMFNVPQYVDVEDKVVGPLTAKQFGWMLGMGGVLFLLWVVLTFPAFVVAGIPVAILFCLFAFYRPNGQTFLSFLTHWIFFLFRPKVYTWYRPEGVTRLPQKPQKVHDETPDDSAGRQIPSADLSVLAQTLNSEGMQRHEEIEDILKRIR